jgi:hypothetical protein
VARDVLRGYYSVADARQRFGVVLDGHGQPDLPATQRLRAGALQGLEESSRIKAHGDA